MAARNASTTTTTQFPHVVTFAFGLMFALMLLATVLGSHIGVPAESMPVLIIVMITVGMPFTVLCFLSYKSRRRK